MNNLKSLKSKEEVDLFLEKISQKGMVMTLTPLLNLCRMLGNPQNKVPVVHIAGTNGKGSVLSMTSCVLETSGLRVGKFFSPQVFDDEPAVTVNGKAPSEAERLEIFSGIITQYENMESQGLETPTLFEIETLAALMFFAENRCDVAVVECGMGGKDDATNIIASNAVCVITSVGLDHMKFLGETVGEIAQNKAGIFNENCTAVCAEQSPEALAAVEKQAKIKGCKLIKCQKARLIEDFGIDGQSFEYKGIRYKIPLVGFHQLENAAAAIEALFALNEKGFKISKENIQKGLESCVWHGRFEKIADVKNIPVIIDGAHNAAAARAWAQNAGRILKGRKIILIFGILADKQYEQVVRIIAPKACEIVTFEVANERTLSAQKLAGECLKYTKARAAKSVEEAVRTALKIAEKSGGNPAVCAVGSFYSLNSIRKSFLELL